MISTESGSGLIRGDKKALFERYGLDPNEFLSEPSSKVLSLSHSLSLFLSLILWLFSENIEKRKENFLRVRVYVLYCF